MCGICGVIQIGGESRQVVTSDVLDRMTDTMTHRGPNDRGTLRREGVALGVRRLSIVDVGGGHQPFSSEDGGVWAVQNGELYNHDVLRKQLQGSGHKFRSRCDTEVIPHLYEERGDDFVKHLRGKFGLAVWDDSRRRAVIARDRLGIKPLYHAVVGDLLVFASELKALLASGLVEPTLDYEAIDAYLTLGYVPGPCTPLEGISKLPPGAILIVDGRGVRTEEYWSYPTPTVVSSRLSADEYGEQLLHELEESVRLRLMSDVPLGAMLSGGLDSSLVVALMARHMDDPVKTFSVGFAGSASGNELADARMVASAFGTDHHELELSQSDEVSLEELVWHLDEPLASLSSLGFLALSRLAATQVTVALSGQGADELLGGYRKHLAASLAGLLPAPLAAAGGRLLGFASAYGQPAAVLKASEPAERLLAMSGRLDAEIRRHLVRGPLAQLDGDAALRAVRKRQNGFSNTDPLASTLYLDAQLALVDDMLHYFDRTSMAHSLEVRVPFLDHHVVEYCATIPPDLKVRRLTTKYLLKRVARGVVPDSVIEKRKTGFFHRATDDWLRAQIRGPMADYLLGPNPRYAELLEPRTVRRLAEDHLSGRDPRNGHLLLAVLMLEVWLASFLPRATALSAARAAAQPVPA